VKKLCRGFVFSVLALGLALSVCTIVLSALSMRATAAAPYAKFNAVESKDFAVGSGFRFLLGNSAALALKAAAIRRNESGAPFANATCVVSALALYGNATAAQCPGETFGTLETADRNLSIQNWLSSISQLYSYAGTASQASLAGLSISGYNSTHAGVYAQISANSSVFDASAGLSRAHSAEFLIDMGALPANPFG